MSEDEIRSALGANRLHVPDTDSEALEIINTFLTQSEKEDLKEREPELEHELRENLILKEHQLEASVGDESGRH